MLHPEEYAVEIDCLLALPVLEGHIDNAAPMPMPALFTGTTAHELPSTAATTCSQSSEGRHGHRKYFPPAP